MVWVALAVNIGIALLSAGVMYAMRDKTKPPRPDPPPFDPDTQIPMVTESAVIPVVFGTRMIASPNVVHLGAWGSSEELYFFDPDAELGINLNAKKRRYRLDMIFAVCAGPVDAIVRVDVDNRTLLGPEDLDRVGSAVAFDLSTVGVGAQVTVSEPNFFGEDAFPFAASGYEVGIDDGLAGRIYASAGALTDTLITATEHGYPTEELGELRGLLTVGLRGLAAGSPDDFLERAGAPFYHGTSNRLRPWRFVVERIMRRGFDDPQWYTAAARIAASVGSAAGQCYDMNPAHIVHELLTDRAWGLGLDSSVIDDPNFTAAADLFATEGAGMSLLWDGEGEMSAIMREVERTTDSIVYYDEQDGLWRIKPIRDDWTLAALPVLDASNVVAIPSYACPSTDDLPTTVSVVYFDREEMRERVYTVHDQAAISSRGGREIVETLRYPGVVTRSHIRSIAHRDLRTLGRARSTVEIEAQPSAAEDLRRGDPFRLTWDEWGIDAVYRVAEIDYGTVVDPTITISAIEDVFTDRESFYDEPESGQGTTAVGEPQDCAPVVAEIPYWMWAREPFAPFPLDDWIAESGTDPTWKNRAIVWAPRPVDVDGLPLWEHSGFRVAEQVHDPDTATNEGLVSVTGRATFANRVEITAPIVRDATSTIDVEVGATFGDHVLPVSLSHSSPYWSPRVGDVIRVEASSPTTSPTIVLDDTPIAGLGPKTKHDYSHLDAGSHEFLIVVRVVSSTEVYVLRGCFDTVVHETIAAQTALVVGWVPVSDYGLWDVAQYGRAWYSVNPQGWSGNHGLGVERLFSPVYDVTAGRPEIPYVDVRPLTRTPAGEQAWADVAANIIEIGEPDDATAIPAALHRAIRPLAPGAVRVVDDTTGLEVRVECEARNRKAAFMLPQGLLAKQAEALPPDAAVWEVDPDLYSECWIFDGTVDPPELVEVLSYDSVEGAFVWANADEEAAHSSKYGTSELFGDLWFCVLTNNKSDVDVNKGRPSYQFTRLRLTRTIVTASGSATATADAQSKFYPTSYEAYYEAADTASLAVNSDGTGGTPALAGTVGRWLDQGGDSTADGRQASASLQPERSTINSRPSVYFDGSDRLSVSKLGMFNAVSGAAVMAVGVQTGTGTNPAILTSSISTGTAGKLGLLIISADQRGHIFARRLDGDAYQSANSDASAVVTLDESFGLVGIADFANGERQCDLNEIEGTPTTYTAGTSGATNCAQVMIGDSPSNFTTRTYYTGHLERLIVLARTPTTQEIRLFGRSWLLFHSTS